MERVRQNEKWGEQNHPDGTGKAMSAYMAQLAKFDCDTAARKGTVSWEDILREEAAEVFAETDTERIKAELVEVAAVCQQWFEAIERRNKG